MVRSFDNKPIEDEKLRQILKNILSGPSAGYSQGTHIVVLKDKISRTKFYEQWGTEVQRQAYRTTWPNLENAPVILLLCADESRYRQRYDEPDKTSLDEDTMPWWLIDTGMAALLGLLSAVDQDLVASFTGIKSQGYMHTSFDIPADIICIGAILLGYQKGGYRPSGSVSRGKRGLDEVVHYNGW